MEIKSFEPYHIGTKLQPHVNLDILGSKLRKALKANGYEGTEKPVIGFPIKIVSPSEVLGIKEQVRVELNLQVNALNTMGEDPENVIVIFKEVNSILPDLSYDLEASVAFYEIVTNILISSRQRPTVSITKALKIDLKALEDIDNVVIDSLRIVNETLTDEQGYIRIIIEPNPNNPKKMYLVRLVYRSPEKEIMESFHNSLQSRVLKVIQSLE